MKDTKKILCVITSVIILYFIYTTFLHEHFQNMLKGSVERKNHQYDGKNIPVFYR